jgi:uncharacterized protein
MKAMQRLSAIFLVALVTSACVTIHIYFPAAAAEEAARTIVRDVLEINGPPAGEPGETTEPTSRGLSPGSGLGFLAWTMDRLVPAAAAQTPDLRIETPTTSRLRASMRARNAALTPYFLSGAIGFGNDGARGDSRSFRGAAAGSFGGTAPGAGGECRPQRAVPGNRPRQRSARLGAEYP